MSSDQRLAVAVKEQIRTHTQAVRNPGYPDQILRIAKGIFAPLDVKLEAAIGVRFEHLIRFFLNVEALIESRISSHLKRSAEVWRAHSVSAVVAAYARIRPDLEETKNQMIQKFIEMKMSRDEVKETLITHHDLLVPELLTFSAQELASLYPAPVDLAALRSFLERISHRFGSLEGNDPERFFLENPVWRCPIILTEQETFFICNAATLRSFAIEIFEEAVEQTGLSEHYRRSRAQFLEPEVARLCKIAFPTAIIHRNVYWVLSGDTKEYETDVLIIIDEYVLVIEAKAGKVTPAAKRGGDGSLRSVAKTLIVEPACQAVRFANAIALGAPIRFTRQKIGLPTVNLPLNPRVITVGITLDHLSTLASSTRSLRESGIVPPETPLIPNMPIWDFEHVLHILDGTAQRLHYLARRTELESNLKYLGDEQDMLALYIESAFNLGEMEFDGTFLHVLGKSQDLERYLGQSGEGDEGKPKRRMTDWWSDIIVNLEVRRPKAWLEIAFTLLNVTFEGQRRIKKAFQRKTTAVKLWGNTTEPAVFWRNGPRMRREHIVVFAYRDMSRESCRARIEELLTNLPDAQSGDRVVFIARDVDQDAPYNLIGMASIEDDVCAIP
jgi:hypothetical protein